MTAPARVEARDLFAAIALQMLINDREKRIEAGEDWKLIFAVQAYRIADVALQVRAGEHDNLLRGGDEPDATPPQPSGGPPNRGRCRECSGTGRSPHPVCERCGCYDVDHDCSPPGQPSVRVVKSNDIERARVKREMAEQDLGMKEWPATGEVLVSGDVVEELRTVLREALTAIAQARFPPSDWQGRARAALEASR